jgi:hypothetical protein
MSGRAGIDLYWLPLGAGGHSVRLNGRVFEAVASRLDRRPPLDLYHAALVVRTGNEEIVIEQAPDGGGISSTRGVVARGPVGSRLAGRLRIFRYEVRCWPGGVVPDLAEAVDSSRRLTDDPEVVRGLLAVATTVPTPVWGRDELGLGEMWSSNSTISWLLASCGLPAEEVVPPPGGRAPGWHAGVVLARRDTLRTD